MASKYRWLISLLLVVYVGSGCSDTPTATDSGPPSPDLGLDRGSPDMLPPDSSAPKDSGPDVPVMAPDLGTVPPLQWVSIKAGTFKMGSPANEMCREPESTKETLHQVTLTRSYLVSKYEVTQAQFAALLWYNPSKNKACGLDCPVEKISWHEAAAFVNALSLKAGLTACYACTGKAPKVICKVASAFAGPKFYTCPGYRLPTEAEWEHAYRAGTTSALYSGELTKCMAKDPVADKSGWYKHNSGGVSHPVGKMAANPWGLYDMAGGVWEWCNDWWSIDLGSAAATDPTGSTDEYYRIIRGGSWYGWSYNLRGAQRFQKPATYTCHGIGLRPVRTVLTASPDAGL